MNHSDYYVKDFLKEYENSILENAEALREEPLPYLTEDLFSIYEKNGNRLIYENLYFKRRKFLLVYGLASIISHRSEDLWMLERIICCICEEECWALPAHVKRNNNAGWRRTVDLFASETAQALMEVVSVLKDELPEYLFRLVCDNVQYRVLEPFYSSDIPYNFWEKGNNNWNAVCCGAIGSASIYWYWDDTEKLNQCLERICASLEYYLKSFPEDGVCVEGLSYFTYGMAYFIGFAEQLLRFSEGNINLLEDSRVKRVALFQQKCYFKGGRTVCFSDGYSKERYRMGLTCFLAGYYEGVLVPPVKMAAKWDTDFNYRWMSAYRDYIWTKDYIENGFDKVGYYENAQFDFKDAQWSILHGPKEIGIGIKGGTNGESHNHNDIGSFFYLCGDEMFLADLGAGEYTKDYFGTKRYEFIGNSSYGHNVPIMNGKYQLAGSEYRCTYFKTDEKGKIELDFGAAYGKENIRRQYDFDFGTGSLLVTDYLNEEDDVIENLVTYYKPEIHLNEILLKGKHSICCIELPVEKEIRISTENFMNHKGIPEKIYLIQWDVAHATSTEMLISILEDE